MTIQIFPLTDDSVILNTARVTVWKDDAENLPSDKFMKDIYFKEHSPIRAKTFLIEIRGIKSWIATHLVRHHEGYTPYVSTQRDDRHKSDIPRDELPQGALVNMDIVINAQAFINVSRKRLCNMAHKETRDVWREVVNELAKIDPNLARCCVRECVYRGGICPECDKSCQYNKSHAFGREIQKYLEGRG